ncbi:MAG: MerR family DNA-binding transcriptional regulator [Ectothiorhodospiraceae bacterium]|nr:MerR family DNA-binding transcriptional regulator [Ectothiorhodospiraceae bacterium]
MAVQFTIGKLARAADVKVDTVRYYERIGLLPAAPRSAAGYRQYGQADLRQLQFIRSAQLLGFSLDEIGTLLQGVNAKGDRARVRALAAERLADLER